MRSLKSSTDRAARTLEFRWGPRRRGLIKMRTDFELKPYKIFNFRRRRWDLIVIKMIVTTSVLGRKWAAADGPGHESRGHGKGKLEVSTGYATRLNRGRVSFVTRSLLFAGVSTPRTAPVTRDERP